MERPSGVASRSSARHRLWIALAGSALLHFLGASMPVAEISPGLAGGNGESLPITLQLERAPLTPPIATTSPVKPRPGPQRHSRPVAELPTEECCSGPAGLPAPVDPTVYTAGELDSLPVPVAPLDLGSSASLRLELTIDEHGAVHSVSIAGSRMGLREKELRAALAATVFVPARKDGRSVKSRIVLGVE